MSVSVFVRGWQMMTKLYDGGDIHVVQWAGEVS